MSFEKEIGRKGGVLRKEIWKERNKRRNEREREKRKNRGVVNE